MTAWDDKTKRPVSFRHTDSLGRLTHRLIKSPNITSPGHSSGITITSYPHSLTQHSPHRQKESATRRMTKENDKKTQTIKTLRYLYPRARFFLPLLSASSPQRRSLPARGSNDMWNITSLFRCISFYRFCVHVRSCLRFQSISIVSLNISHPLESKI